MKRPQYRLAVTLLAASVTVAACVSDPETDKIGAPVAGQTTLRLGAAEDATAPYAPQLEQLAATVDVLSQGALRIDIVWEAAGAFTGRSEVELAELVRDGELDLALVPARVWDELGVTSMDALQTPMLIDDEELLARVTGLPVADEMLAGLTDIDVQPLGMLPDSVRRPIGFEHEYREPSDLRGARLRSPFSKASELLAIALGYEAVAPDVPNSEYGGAESAYVWAPTLPSGGTFTGNVALSAKANTLVANGSGYRSWSDSTRQVLISAAEEAHAFAVQSTKAESQLALAYCGAGGSVVLATADELELWRAAVEPVVEALQADTRTRQLIEELGSIKSDSAEGPDLAAPCGNRVTGTSTQPDTGESTGFPNGTYRTDSPIEGVVTFVFEDGTWRRYFEDGTLDCEADYTVLDGRIIFISSADPTLACGNEVSSRFLDSTWALEGDQLSFDDINSDPNAIAEFGLPWTKIE